MDGKLAREDVFFGVFVAGNVHIVNIENMAFGNIKRDVEPAVFNGADGVHAHLQVALVGVLLLDGADGVVKIFLVVEFALAEEDLLVQFLRGKHVVAFKRNAAEIHLFAFRYVVGDGYFGFGVVDIYFRLA